MVEQIAAIAAMVAALPQGQRPHFEVGLSTAFGCTIEGPIPDDQIVRLAEQAIAAGAAEVCLSDTTGYANPAQVRRLVRAVKAAVGADRLNTLHLHNTRGLGLANVVAGLEEGITSFRFIHGRAGRMPVRAGCFGQYRDRRPCFMLEAMGLHTGIDIARLGDVRQIIADALPGEPLYGFVPDAGVPLGFERVAA